MFFTAILGIRCNSRQDTVSMPKYIVLNNKTRPFLWNSLDLKTSSSFLKRYSETNSVT